MKKINFLLVLIFISTLFGCSPTLLFTNEQFIDVYSNISIPNKWQGKWQSTDSSLNCLIAHDTISIDGFNYKIKQSNLNLGLDSLNGNDKLIFQDDWCFLSIYKTIDSIPKLSGYQVLIGHIDNDNNILCWEMSYDYFLNQRLIDQIPVLKFENKNLKENSEIKKMKNTFVYIPLPKDNKKLYKKIVKKINLAPSVNTPPALCDESFDINFYKNVAKSRKPDIILTKQSLMIKRKKNNLEKKYERMTNRNLSRYILKRVID